ncbi:MAG: hypothetical protein GF346_08760 [Candidatus Eisenbacteria bacterium]|nr:hypothetical protein [Candidatus Latescibacterota bacterium]MBD3302526.1 hypothetical protein [Candidatus Eisenbacteria bacterium]
MRTASVVLVAISLLGLHVAVATAISLTDYTFPKSTSQQAYLNGIFNTAGNSADSTEVGYNFAGSASYLLDYRSLPFSYNLDVLGNFSVAKSTIEDSESEEAYFLRMTTVADKYLRDDSNLFGFGGGRLEYRKLASQEDADDPRIDLEVGVGYGRTINATVLKQAIRINEDFLKYQVISGDIPDNALLELAQVIEKEGEYRSRHGNVEYRKYWFEDMEQIVRDAGVLTGQNLGAIGILRIQEVLAEPTAQRWHGWVARAGVGVQVSDFDGESGDPTLSARFDWTRPVDIKLQLSNRASFFTVLEDDPVYQIADEFRVDYEVSNRIDWYNSATLNYDIPTMDGLENILRLNLKSTYIFYIENQLSLNPEFQYQFIDDGLGDSEWNWAILGSVTYRLK